MAGFPFPDGEASNREQSWDSGTPFSSGGDILIDPALSEVPLDPALMAEEGVPGSSELSQPPPLYPHNYLSRVQEYLQGPRGDPFAQPPPLYFPNEEPLPLPPKPLKKKKRPPARRERCDVCKGNEMRNQYGKSEQMVSCMDCGASVHPSCIRFYNRGELLRSLGWQCFTCKSCSVCKRKGNEASMLMCDFCDRGWHMSCFDPPFQEPPEGRWHCPTCPSVEDSQPWLEDAPPEQPPHLQEISSSSLPIRESSVASSSHHIPPSSDAPAFFDDVLTTDASELEVEHIDPTDPTPRRSSRKRKSRKGKEVAWEDDMGQHISPVTPVPTIRRLRIHVNSPPPHPADNETPTIRLRVPARGKGKAREDPPSEESERGLFDDILSVEDRDVRDTSMGVHDHERFERSRSNAEQRIAPRPPPDPPETPIAGPSHRPSLRSHAPITPRLPSASMSPAPTATPGPQAMYLPNGLRIRKIRFGEYDIDTWYDAPFPEEYAAIPDGRLWMCEFCLKYMKSRFSATRHQLKCKVRHPPGDEIYRDGKISIFEVDGRKNKIYCQNLCLLSKMFLDHKSLFYDVEPFLFYVMTETDDAGAHFVGYFSKEKLSPKDYNVSCIMTLPVRQRQGWGNLLIDFSYLLSKKEQRAGSPEKPLSALGALGYRNYWTLSLMRYLQTAPPNPTLEDISAVTSMTLEDIHTTLVHLNMISVLDSAQPPKPLPGQAIKFPKGRKNGIARKHLQRTHTHDDERAKGPFVPPTRYKVRWDAEQVDNYLARWEAKGYLRLTPEKLKWSPFILSRAKKTQSSEGEASFGSGTGDVTRGVSTDAQLSEMNGTAREGARSSAEARRLVEQTRSPAFSLFDDDNVEMIRPSALSETTEADGSLGRSSVDPAETFRGKRNLLRDVSPSIRRLRSRDPVNESTPLRRLPHTPRADNSSQSDGRRHPLRSRPADISATIPLPDDVNGHAPSLDDDAALAARLAMELDNPRRQLRSRHPSTDQMHVQKRHVPISRSVSPRKRRRVDSSPEVELTPSPRSPVTRRSGRNGETAFASPKAIPATPSRKSSRRTNGRSPSKYALRQEEEEEEEDLPQAPVGGGMVDGGAATDGEEPEDANYEEGADTPATGAASSHSVPSDDTMIGAELARSKVSPISRMLAADMDPLSVLAQVAGQVANGDVVLDDGGEEDAEGEEDVDAEGEPDRDVDP